jgi:hypothetical protein
MLSDHPSCDTDNNCISVEAWSVGDNTSDTQVGALIIFSNTPRCWDLSGARQSETIEPLRSIKSIPFQYLSP